MRIFFLLSVRPCPCERLVREEVKDGMYVICGALNCLAAHRLVMKRS